MLVNSNGTQSRLTNLRLTVHSFLKKIKQITSLKLGVKLNQTLKSLIAAKMTIPCITCEVFRLSSSSKL